MAKVVLVSHDVQTVKDGCAGGVGAFVTHFARLLREAGDEVTILLTRQETFPVAVDAAWRRRYEAWGIGLIELHNEPADPERWNDPWPARLARLVTPLLRGFDIAYFQDWANVAFDAARRKRFGDTGLPLLVTVLHGPSGWVRVGEERNPEIPGDLHLDYIERYAARHSDFVVSPSRYMVEWTGAHGWSFAREPVVLGLPFRAKAAAVTTNEAPTHIVFFGRIETRKGVALFTAALVHLFHSSPASIARVSELVLLGQAAESSALASALVTLNELRIDVMHLGDKDSRAANEYLREHVRDALVVIPSRAENFPYAVIETASIPGLNVIYSNGGGAPEIFAGARDEDLFEPYPLGLAAKLAERLAAPGPPPGQPGYDAAAANARWLAFHGQALETRPAEPKRASASARLDLCIPHFNQTRHLAGLLAALAAEPGEFGVIVVDDGSNAVERAAFDRLAIEYGDRGWIFHAQTNQFVDAARNRAASLSAAEYLLFVDADDLPVPGAVGELVNAILRSGDDCLVPGGLLFAGDAPNEILARYMPLGPDLVCGLVDPMVLGTSMIIVRRSAFLAIDGYRPVRGAAHEDWELQIRLVMAGFRVDVFPEFLLNFRKSEHGLSQTSAEFAAKQRLIDTYDAALSGVGLQGLAAVCVSLLASRNQLQSAFRESRDERTQRLHGLVAEMLRRTGKPA